MGTHVQQGTTFLVFGIHFGWIYLLVDTDLRVNFAQLGKDLLQQLGFVVQAGFIVLTVVSSRPSCNVAWFTCLVFVQAFSLCPHCGQAYWRCILHDCSWL